MVSFDKINDVVGGEDRRRPPRTLPLASAAPPGLPGTVSCWACCCCLAAARSNSVVCVLDGRIDGILRGRGGMRRGKRACTTGSRRTSGAETARGRRRGGLCACGLWRAGDRAAGPRCVSRPGAQAARQAAMAEPCGWRHPDASPLSDQAARRSPAGAPRCRWPTQRGHESPAWPFLASGRPGRRRGGRGCSKHRRRASSRWCGSRSGCPCCCCSGCSGCCCRQPVRGGAAASRAGCSLCPIRRPAPAPPQTARPRQCEPWRTRMTDERDIDNNLAAKQKTSSFGDLP